ncbi:M20 family metallopeptidase [Corticicoccus populi]|uniref:M20 family metallopeptidase n=1 Tax=Corticicoccus populi TaxID=1812821 RepID=A0ABW5WZY3_9STAP
MDFNNQLSDMLNMLEEIVNMDSGSYDKEGIDAFGKYLQNLYSAIGFQTEEVLNNAAGNNLVIKHKDAENPEIIILAHMDTVFTKGTAEERPFTVKKERAYGPGVIDMKASHVMLYHTLKYLVEQGDNTYKNVILVFNSDEEIGSKTSKNLIIEKSRGKKYALVLEPARIDGSIVSSRRGSSNYQLNITGVAAHSGIEPDNGRSAIKELAHKIFKIEALSRPEEGLHVNVVQISGGKASNIIAPNATASVDVRISTQAQGEWVDSEIKKIVAQADVEGTVIELSGGLNRPPMEFTEGTDSLVHLIQREGRKLGIEVQHTATGGGSDASFPAAIGIDTIDGLGPVGGAQHSDDEYLEINTLTERTALFTELLKSIGHLN